jgi:hypothetical protein
MLDGAGLIGERTVALEFLNFKRSWCQVRPPVLQQAGGSEPLWWR